MVPSIVCFKTSERNIKKTEKTRWSKVLMSIDFSIQAKEAPNKLFVVAQMENTPDMLTKISVFVPICRSKENLQWTFQKVKVAKVVPNYKTAGINTFESYRQISLLPVISKKIERAIYNRMVSYIDRFNRLNSNQFGFRQKLKTIDALA